MLVYWAGTPESLEWYVENVLSHEVQQRVGSATTRQDDSRQGASRLLQVQDGIGVVSIKGTLVNRDSWINELFGLVSYNEIREALVAAAEDPKVRGILLYIDSPGGAALGVSDTAELISTVGKVKPMMAYTPGMMASAAMWLGAAAPQRFAAADATLGSIGVIVRHLEYTQMMKKEGITPTVVRAGKYKALVNPYEKLSDRAKTQLKEELAYRYNLFISAIGNYLGVSPKEVHRKMADGRTFIGQQAVDVGLIDGVRGYDEVFAEIQQAAAKRQRQSGGRTMKKTLSSAALAAAAAGVPLEDFVQVIDGGTEPTAEDAPAASAEDAPAASAEDAPVTSAEDAPVASAEDAPVAESKSAQSAVDVLTAQLKEKEDKVVDLTLQVRTLEAKVQAFEKVVPSMREIVKQGIANMLVAMGGGTTAHLEGLSDEALLAQYQVVSTEFKQKFKAGGVAATAGAEEEPKQQAAKITRLDRVLRQVAKIS